MPLFQGASRNKNNLKVTNEILVDFPESVGPCGYSTQRNRTRIRLKINICFAINSLIATSGNSNIECANLRGLGYDNIAGSVHVRAAAIEALRQKTIPACSVRLWSPAPETEIESPEPATILVFKFANVIFFLL